MEIENFLNQPSAKQDLFGARAAKSRYFKSLKKKILYIISVFEKIGYEIHLKKIKPKKK